MEKNTVAAEANGIENIEFDVEIRGQKVTLKCVADLMDAPFSVVTLFEDGKNLNAFQELLGQKQVSHLKRIGVTARDFSEIIIPA